MKKMNKNDNLQAMFEALAAEARPSKDFDLMLQVKLAERHEALSQKTSVWSIFRFKSSFVYSLLLVLFVGSTSTYAYVSDNVVNGDVLYPVKRVIESVEASFVASSEGKIDYYEKMAERRIRELEYLEEKGVFDGETQLNAEAMLELAEQETVNIIVDTGSQSNLDVSLLENAQESRQALRRRLFFLAQRNIQNEDVDVKKAETRPVEEKDEEDQYSIKDNEVKQQRIAQKSNEALQPQYDSVKEPFVARVEEPQEDRVLKPQIKNAIVLPPATNQPQLLPLLQPENLGNETEPAAPIEIKPEKIAAEEQINAVEPINQASGSVDLKIKDYEEIKRRLELIKNAISSGRESQIIIAAKIEKVNIAFEELQSGKIDPREFWEKIDGIYKN